jgi:GIY-YIG catalytic domain
MIDSKLPIKPIVEFFPVMDHTQISYLFYPKEGDELTKDQLKLRANLADVSGVYAFYNSEAEIIYVGSTEKQNLLKRMTQSLSHVRTKYKRYYVEHGKYNGKPKKIIRRSVALWQVAEFFSAYEVDSKFIKALEQFVIRMIPNDLVNAKIEGNGKRKLSPKRDRMGAQR